MSPIAAPDPTSPAPTGPPRSGEPELAPPGGTVPSYRRTLANRPFALLWVSQLISQSGDFVFQVALLWLVLELTGSPFAVGLVVASSILPSVLLGPFLGVCIDRWNRLRTLVVTNVVEGVAIAGLSGLVIAGRADLPGLLAIVLMLGAGGATVRIATNAYVPSVVPVHDLPPANGLLSLSGSLNQIVGLSIGGVVVALLGVDLPIEYDALTFFVAAIVLLGVPRASTPGEVGAAPTRPAFRREFSEGISFIRAHRFMVELILVGILVNFFAIGVFALFAPFSDYVLHGGPAVYGTLGALVAAGSLVGALGMGRVDTRGSAGRYLFAGGLGLGGATLVLGLAGVLSLALALMFVFGAALSVANIPIAVVMQAKTPGRMLGRVSAAFGALITGSGPAGPLFAGWLAGRWSVGAVFLVSGGIICGVVGLGAVTMRSLRTVQY